MDYINAIRDFKTAYNRAQNILCMSINSNNLTLTYILKKRSPFFFISDTTEELKFYL